MKVHTQDSFEAHTKATFKVLTLLLPPASPKTHRLQMSPLMPQKMFKEHNTSNTVGTKQARLTLIAQGCQDEKPINIWQ